MMQQFKIYVNSQKKELIKLIILLLYKKVIKMIDLNKLDPDWKQASQHGQASKTGIIPHKKGNGTISICHCCFNVVYKDPAPLCANSKQLQFLGFGFPLYYVFLKNCIILLLLSICSYNALSLYWGLHNNYDWCHSTTTHRRMLASSAPTCETFMVEMSRVEQTVAMEEQILRIMSFVIQLFFLIYMRDKLIKLESYYDQRTTSLSDYSIIMKNVPPQEGIRQKIKNFFLKEFKEPHNIQNVIFLPESEEIKQLMKKKMQLIDQQRVFYKNQNLEDEEFRNLKKQINNVNRSISEQAEKINLAVEKDTLQCEKIILIFNTDEEKTQILEEFMTLDIGKRGQYFGVGSESISLREAPEPKQILWENINIKTSKKVFYKILGWFLSILLLVIVTVIFYFIMEQKALNLIIAIQHIEQHPDDPQYQEDYNGAVALVYIMLFLIVLFNKLLMVVLFHKFTDLERHDTSSKYQFSFGLKYCLGLFFTTALMTLAVEALRFQNYYSHLYGVIQEQTVMFFLNALFVPLFWLINPFQLIKLAKRSLNFGKRELTQGQAHHLMEDSEYDIGKRYAEIIETMWFTYLYATIIPIGAGISFVGLIFYYWVDKYNLLRRSTLSIQVQGRLVKFTMKLLDFTLIFKPVGQIMFDQQIRHTYTIGSIVMIIVAFFYLLIPIDDIIDFFNPEKFNLQQKTYQEVKPKFKDTYRTLQPIFRLANPMKVSQKLIRAKVSMGAKTNSFEELDGKLITTEEKNLEIDLKFDNTVSQMY